MPVLETHANQLFQAGTVRELIATMASGYAQDTSTREAREQKDNHSKRFGAASVSLKL
jgi:hypothetical protein